MTKEEAIKVASEIYGWLKTDREREALETLIPELREDESEDESKRKSLIRFLTDIKEISESGRTTWAVRKEDAEMCKSFLVYLEKQKEISLPNSTELIEMWDEEKAMLEEKDFRDDAWRLTQNAFMDGFARGTCVKSEKQKEQKRPNGCFTCDEYKKGYDEGRRNGFTAGYNKAMKEVEQKEQKPWKVGANAYFTPEQKPAEWSEEDEAMRDNILRCLQCFVGTVECESTPSLSTSYPLYRREIDWLKSLRPSWKPSEEQMEALERASTNKYLSAKQFDILVSLYEQLKKLM